MSVRYADTTRGEHATGYTGCASISSAPRELQLVCTWYAGTVAFAQSCISVASLAGGEPTTMPSNVERALFKRRKKFAEGLVNRGAVKPIPVV